MRPAPTADGSGELCDVTAKLPQMGRTVRPDRPRRRKSFKKSGLGGSAVQTREIF